MSTHTSTVFSPVAGASSRRHDNSFRGRISRSKIVRLEKVLVRLSECLTEEINNLIDEEPFRPRRLWVRKGIVGEEVDS